MVQLQALLASLVPNNRFYSHKLPAAALTSPTSRISDLLQGIPFTTKQELVDDQRDHPPYGSNLSYPLRRYTRLSQTSATTGRPIHWLDTPESWQWMLKSWDQIYRSAGVGADDRVFFAASFAPFLGFWTAFDSAVRRGCLSIPGGGMSSAARLRMILEHQVSVLCCVPTYALRLGEVAAEEGIDLRIAKVKTLIVAGEPGGSIPSTRTRIQHLWNGAKVVDHHGMTEMGPVSYECPHRQGVLHVIEAAYIAEVVDPKSGQVVGPSEKGWRGELVLSNLGRMGSPLLRYRTGDLVQPALQQPCPCGSYELALEGGILGRTDDMVVVRGINVYPSAVEEIVLARQEVAEYRVEIQQEGQSPALRIQIEPAADCLDTARLVQELESTLRRAFALHIPISLVPRGKLPRFKMKARRWIRR